MVNEFQNAMHTSGIVCKEAIIADGQLHRFANNGKGDKDGWLVFHGHTEHTEIGVSVLRNVGLRIKVICPQRRKKD